MDPLLLNVVNGYRHRVAGTTQINVNWVEKMRRDFLILMKDLPLVKDYDDAAELKEAFDVYKGRFKLLMFEQFLNEYKSNGDHRFDKLGTPAWDFYLELAFPLMSPSLPAAAAGKEVRFQRFLMDKGPWEKKIKVRAQKFWKAIKDALENVPDSEIRVKTPDRDRLVIEGFQAEIYGFNPQEDWQQETLSKFKESLRIYRRNASKTVPWLIRHQLPIEVNFEGKLDQGGEYLTDHIMVSMLSMTGESPLWGAHMMAHEMAHHMYKGLSGSAQEYWDTAIRQDYGPLDLKELLAKWPDHLTWSTDFTDYMSTKDPILALQVDVLSHGHQSTHAYETREDFQSGFDAGVTTLKVPRNPVTGYAGKKPEEAFCDAIGRLVAYGSATVLDQVKAWLKTVIPGEVKFSSKKEPEYPDQIPGGLADNGPPKNVDPVQVEKGLRVEHEHTSDLPDIAREITYDHLTEDPNYYTKLEKMEKNAWGLVAERVARLFIAGLVNDLEKRIEVLLNGEPRDVDGAIALSDWIKKNFKVGVRVRGHKELAGELDRLVEILTQYYGRGIGDPTFGQSMVKTIWNRGIKPRLDELTKYFTDEGGSKLVSDYKIGSNTYLNKVGMSEDNLIKYATRLDALFGSLSGWRKKALSGGLTVALAPPKYFHGTASGKYRSSEDTLYVRAIPKVLQRSGGSYGSIDYILIHELGHRYEHFHRLPVDFDKPEWWTSRYSMTESLSGSESFAELFAIGHFNITGPWDQSKVERFEKLMG